MLSIYIEDKAANAAGKHTGTWVTLPIGKRRLSRIIFELLLKGEQLTRGENHREVIITDYEWSFMTEITREIAQDESLYDLNREAFLLSELGDTSFTKISFPLTRSFKVEVDKMIEARQRAYDLESENTTTLAHTRLIQQVADYYNETLKDISFYAKLDCPTLVALSQTHLAHWKKRLHELIFTPTGGAV